MTPIEVELAQQRARLLRIEQAHTRTIITAYAAVAARLQQNLHALVREIESAEQARIEVRPAWLFAQDRYRRLITDLVDHTEAFLVKATGAVTAGQREAVQAAFDDGRRLAKLALGPGPDAVVARVTSTWNRLPAASLDRLIGRASDGGPLNALLNELAPAAPIRVRDTLAYGVAAGKNPRALASEVQSAAAVTRNRALVIARTEIVGANREGQTETWRHTRAVTSWRWQSAKDRRTCAACWAQDGTEHPIDEAMATHPQCRCAKVPVTASWADLGFPGIPDTRPVLTTGPQAFERLPDSDKLAIVGPAKLRALNAGEITLTDLVRHTHSPRWGAGAREATLAEALA